MPVPTQAQYCAISADHTMCKYAVSNVSKVIGLQNYLIIGSLCNLHRQDQSKYDHRRAEAEHCRQAQRTEEEGGQGSGTWSTCSLEYERNGKYSHFCLVG